MAPVENKNSDTAAIERMLRVFTLREKTYFTDIIISCEWNKGSTNSQIQINVSVSLIIFGN
ncbi:hypothetical protein EMIT091MI3_90220 [Kosakonia quasisacchari]